MPYRISRPGCWLKFDKATGKLRASPQKASEATSFPTEEAAKAALEKALSIMAAQFDALFPPGGAPAEGFDGYYAGLAHGDPCDAKASELSRTGWIIRKYSAIESFDEPAPFAERMALPPVFALASADGRYAKRGATGYWTFVHGVESCTLFASAEQARDAYATMRPSEEAALLMPEAKIAELCLSPAASLDPRTLSPSENAATAAMRSLREKQALRDASPQPKAGRKGSKSL